jgi:hypothetical protein
VDPQRVLPGVLGRRRLSPIGGGAALTSVTPIRSAALVFDGQLEQLLTLASPIDSAAPIDGRSAIWEEARDTRLTAVRVLLRHTRLARTGSYCMAQR